MSRPRSSPAATKRWRSPWRRAITWRRGGLRPRWFTTLSACSTRARRSTKPGSTTPRCSSLEAPARWTRRIDWIHTAQVQAQIVRDYVKWDDQPQGALSVAESILRAYQIAMTDPKGPVYLCFDVELQESRLPEGFTLPDLRRYRAPAAPSGNVEEIAEAAKALIEAEWPVMVVEGLGRTQGGPEALQSLVEMLGLPVLEQGS